VKAAILAGGFGTRMRPLTYTRPKPLLPVLGVPMLRRLIDRVPAEVDGVVLAVNYLSEQIRAYLARDPPPVPVEVVDEPQPLGTGGAIKNVERWLGGEPFLVMNGDVVCDADLTAMVAHHRARGGLGTIHLWPVEDPSRYGVVRMEGSERIVDFVEKPARADAPSNLINAGTYVLEPEVLSRIPPGRAVSIEREVFPLLAREGLFAFRGGRFWVDAGKPLDYLEAQRLLMEGEPGRFAPPAPPGAVVEAPVLLSPGARVAPGARVGPHTWLSAGSQVGPRARVVNSVVLDGASVGADAVLESAVVGFGARIGQRARLAPGTVVADAAVVEDGRTTRPDEKVGGPPTPS
jgi:mannose-1-phosphate guanylyltransferase